MSKSPRKLRATPVRGQANTITTLPPAPIDEQRGRMKRYAISMGIRTICVLAVFFVPGWWRLAPAIAAIVLPYFAVVIANAGHDGAAGEVERPGGVELYRPEPFAGYDSPDPAPAPGAESPRPDFERAQEPRPDSSDEPRVYYAPYAPGSAPRRAQPASPSEDQPKPRGDAGRPQPLGDDVQPRPRE